ncbi:MAG: PQQ-binding-like beta-propeller repeat protein [Thermoguttaceae bacterium]
MTGAGKLSGGTARNPRSLLWAIAVRVLVYGGVCLVVAWYLAGFPLPWTPESGSQRQTEGPAPADPGWPHLRGPYYNAESPNTELTDSWPAEGPPVLWTREVGRGYSGVIAVGNRVYTQGQTLADQKVLALDADTGRTIWEHRYGWPYDPGGMYPGPRSTPTWSDGRIYFAGPDGLVGCLRAADGRQLWTVNVNRQFGGRGTDFGYACSPLVEDGKVILPVGGRSAAVVALDADSGQAVWASGDAPASYCSAIPITFHGTRQVVAFLQNELAGFDLKTGGLLWQQSYSSGYDEHAAFPLYDEPYLRTMQPFRAGSDLYMLEAVPRGSDAPDKSGCRLRLVRHDPQMSNDVASSVLVGGCVYGFDIRGAQTSPHGRSRGMFRAIDFKQGNTLWSSDRPGQATIAVADGKLLLFNDRGEVLLVRANPQRYEELARTEVFRGEACWTAPSLHRGRLYLRSPTRVACLYVAAPAGLDRRQRELAVPTSAIPKAHRLELAWLVGAEREYPFELPDLSELARWYVLSLGVVAAAGVLATGVYGVFRLRCRQSARVSARIAFWLGILVLGVLATPLCNRFSGRFVFTWPVSLLAVHQIALGSVFWARQAERGKAAAWCWALGAGLLILALLAYYDLTRRLSLAPAWYFVPAFLAAWPLAIPAARRLVRPGSLLGDLIWMLLTFSVYFWASGGAMLWRTAIVR